MSTDGASAGGSNDVVIPITAEDKLTAVFAQMSLSLDDKLKSMVDSMNRRTDQMSANFGKIASSSKQMDRIGDAVEHIEDRFGSLWKTVLGAGAAIAAWKGFGWLKDSLSDTPLGKAGGAAADAFGKAWDDVIGKLNGRFKPEIDALASGIQYLGDVAVNVVVPELGAMSQAIADLFFGRLQNAGVNAHTFAENTSNNFHGMAVNVVKALALVETAFQNWKTTWEIAVTSAAIGVLNIQDTFKSMANAIDGAFMNGIVMPMVRGMDWMMDKWKEFFDYVIRGAQEWQRVFKGVDMSNPVAGGLHAAARALAMPPTRSKFGHNDFSPTERKNPGPLFDVNANDGARKVLEERLRELMDGMGQAVSVNMERMLRNLGLVELAPLRGKHQAGGGLGGGGGAGGGGGGTGSNLLETGFLTRAGSDSFDPAMATRRDQLSELRDMKRLHTQTLRVLEEIRRNADTKRLVALAAQII